MMNLCVNNPVLQKCWRVFQSHVWKWHKTASDRPPLHWLTPLQVRPPFLVLMGTASHLVFMIQGLHLRSPNWYWLLGMEGSFSVVEQFCCGAHSDYYRQAWDIHLFYFSPCHFVSPAWCRLHPNVQALTSPLSPSAPVLASAGSLTSRWMTPPACLRLSGKRYDRVG